MKKKHIFIFLLIGFSLVSMAASGAVAGNQARDLQQVLESAGPDDEISVIVRLSDKADVSQFKHKEKGRQRADIIKALKDKVDKTQGPVRAFLEKKQAKKIKSLWIINGIAATVPAQLVTELTAFPGVEAVTLDAVVHVPDVTAGTAAVPEWNISAIHAPDLWNMGYTGQGIVVANMDSGVDLDHPDLQSKWRGGTNSWFDPNGEHPLEPYDAHGHGTGTMSIMIGGDAGGSSIGVAPGAQWIAVKIFNDAGNASSSVIHAGFQWLLDPDGNPDMDDAPDVVNNSWGILDRVNTCVPDFQQDVQTLKAAEIAIVFSAGNSGPNLSTSLSPANYPESFSVGAVVDTQTIAPFSSRGPSVCDGSIYPHVVAPGVNVKTADLYLGVPGAYATVSGTSFAAPHVAGAMALLLDAFPDATVSELEEAMKSSVVDLGLAGADNDYGYGLIDAHGAFAVLASARETFAITASAGLGGRVVCWPGNPIIVGAGVTCWIIPDPGYHIANVFVDGVSVGALASYTFSNVTADHKIAAFFTINKYTVTASAGAGGSITPSGTLTVQYGSTQTFTITPNAGHHITGVFVDGAAVGAVTSYTFNNVTANHKIVAFFTINNYTIRAWAGTGGSITPSGTLTAPYGSTLTFTITPNAGYHITGVFVDGVRVGFVGPATSYTFSNVTANHKIAVFFAINKYAVTASAGAGGSITPTGTVTVPYGSSQTFTITPSAGYHITGVFVDGVAVGAVNAYTFSNVTANHKIAAFFTLNAAAIIKPLLPIEGGESSLSIATLSIITGKRVNTNEGESASGAVVCKKPFASPDAPENVIYG